MPHDYLGGYPGTHLEILTRDAEKRRESSMRSHRSLKFASPLATAFVLSGCIAGERGDAAAAIARLATSAVSAVSCGDQFLEAHENTFALSTDSLTAGDTTGIEFTMSTSFDPTLQVYLVTIALPAGFVFLGFDALGAGVEIGTWDFDFGNPDGVFDDPPGFTIPEYAIDFDDAYADSLLNGFHDVGIDPTGAYAPGGAGAHIITLTLPDGGADFGENCTYFASDLRFRLADGLFQLPATPGEYTVSVTAISVDPDTGDATDNAGVEPSVYRA
jgi:hypothetical protein